MTGFRWIGFLMHGETIDFFHKKTMPSERDRSNGLYMIRLGCMAQCDDSHKIVTKLYRRKGVMVQGRVRYRIMNFLNNRQNPS